MSIQQKVNRPRVDADFVDLVRAMREAQRKYFVEKSSGFLEIAKKLEKEVDVYLEGFGVLEAAWDSWAGGYRAGVCQLGYDFGHDGVTQEKPKE